MNEQHSYAGVRYCCLKLASSCTLEKLASPAGLASAIQLADMDS